MTGFLAMALTAGALLAGCGAGDEAARDTSATAATSSTSGSVAQDMADVMFAQMMIPHHQQAVEMSDLALEAGAGASEKVRALAEQIKAAQAPEIQQMREWLASWKVPEMGDHSGHVMAGMLTDEQMATLSAATGAEFDRLWLEGMIAHHEGAIDMAKDVADSANAQVKALAQHVLSSQQAEIDRMRELLTS